MKILYADDSLALAQAVLLVLRADSHNDIHVQDGIEAIAKFKEYTPDLVLMDVMLPCIKPRMQARIVRLSRFRQFWSV